MKYLYILLLSVALSIPASAQITAPAEPVQQTTGNPEAKYLAPLPEENGKVYLLREAPLPEGLTEAQAYEKLQTWYDRCMQDKRIVRHSDVATSHPMTLQQLVTQTITFSSSLIALDQTEMTYVFTASVENGMLRLKMSHMSYMYNGENRDRKMLKYTAEDHIADRVALFRKGSKLVPGYKKFRIKTIDLIDEYEASLKLAFLIK